MKKAVLAIVAVLFVFSGCSQMNHRSSSGGSTTSESSNSSGTSVTSGGSITSGTSITSSSSGTSGESITSDVVPPTQKLFLSSEQITIDLKTSKTAQISARNDLLSTAVIEWSVEQNNLLHLSKMQTNNNEAVTITAQNVGNSVLTARSGELSNSCEINIINSTVKKTSGTDVISIYAVNDYHGHVNETFNLKHYGTFIKQKVNQRNTLFLDQGDTWQGTLKSNYNYGEMINDVYNAAGMSARTVGNHDFDWGDEKLIANSKASYNGYSTPVLAANVYDYNFQTKEVGTTQQSDIGREYVTFTLDSGIKVGVIGVIDDGCEKDIVTQNVMNYEFTNSVTKVRELSDKLRTTEECDVVIASMHEGYSDYIGDRLTQTSSVSHKKYVDLVLNGHTHQNERFSDYNDVTFAQFGGYNSYIGKVNLTYDYSTSSITATNVYTLSTTSLIGDVPTIDPEIDGIVDHYNDISDAIATEVLTDSLSGEFDRYEQMPNLVCKAIYDEAIQQGFDVSYAITNSARQSLSGPTVTYESLYTSLPFDNVIYIIEVSGEDLAREIENGYIKFYRGDNLDARSALDSTKEKYTIAAIDFVAFHTNYSRDYDLFPSVNPLNELRKNGKVYNYREITADYFRSQTEPISADDYSSTSIRHNKDQVNQEIPLV